MFRFGVDSLIWTKDFTVKDLPLIEKVKQQDKAYMSILN